MAIKLVFRDWSRVMGAYVCEFVCDNDTDFSNLPSCATGSSAISVQSGAIRMVNASGEWAEFAE